MLALSPGARSGIADLVDRIPGIHLERRASLPLTRFNDPPSYGEEIDLDEARERFEPCRFASRRASATPTACTCGPTGRGR